MAQQQTPAASDPGNLGVSGCGGTSADPCSPAPPLSAASSAEPAAPVLPLSFHPAQAACGRAIATPLARSAASVPERAPAGSPPGGEALPRRAATSPRPGLPGFELLVAGVLALLLLLGPIGVPPAWAAELKVSEVRLEPCPAEDPGSQPELRRPSGASCYALRGLVSNPGRQPVVDTDVFALILDSSGEPVLPNRSRVGSIGDVPPGESAFALRLAVPAGTPGPFEVRNARARGFKAPVRSRAADGEELLPLEQALADS